MNKLTLTHESSVTETVQETHCNVIDKKEDKDMK